MPRKKITIVGAGRVGSNTAMLCVQRELGDVVIWNRTADTARGLALDISEMTSAENADSDVIGTGDWRLTKNSDVVLITAGLPRKPGMSRSDLLQTNAAIVKDVCNNVKRHSPKTVVIVVTNPLDAMVHVAYRAGFPKERVIGMAGALDASRFRTFIAHELGVSTEDVNALVLGGHGDSMVPLVGTATVGGIPLTRLLQKKKIDALVKHTRNAGAEIVALEKTSSAFYAPAAAAFQMIEAVIKDKKRVLPCAAFLNGEYGERGIFMGVPVVLGSRGVERILEAPLNSSERNALKRSAANVRLLIKELS